MAVDATKLQFWSEHNENWRASGLSQRAYCEREAISLAAFGYWRGRVTAGTQAAKRKAKKRPGGLTLVPVRVAGQSGAEAVVLRGQAGWELRLPGTVDPSWLAAVLKVLS
jgi:hypothetical protein